MNQQIAKNSLSPPRQRLVEVMSRISFGRIEHLHVVDGEPRFENTTRTVQMIKLGAESAPQPPITTSDFLLKSQVLELFGHLERIRCGEIDCIEVQYGLPAKIIIEQR